MQTLMSAAQVFLVLSNFCSLSQVAGEPQQRRSAKPQVRASGHAGRLSAYIRGNRRPGGCHLFTAAIISRRERLCSVACKISKTRVTFRFLHDVYIYIFFLFYKRWFAILPDTPLHSNCLTGPNCRNPLIHAPCAQSMCKLAKSSLQWFDGGWQRSREVFHHSRRYGRQHR